MRRNQSLVLALVWVLVLMVALYIKGDLTASIEGLGMKMLIDVKDKRPSPMPSTSPTPVPPQTKAGE